MIVVLTEYRNGIRLKCQNIWLKIYPNSCNIGIIPGLKERVNNNNSRIRHNYYSKNKNNNNREIM